MLRVAAAQMDHAAVFVDVQNVFVQVGDHVAVQSAGNELGGAAADLTVSRRLGSCPRDHGLQLTRRKNFPERPVDFHECTVDGFEILPCVVRIGEHFNQDFLSVQVDRDVQCACNGRQTVQREVPADLCKAFCRPDGQLERFVAVQIGVLQFTDRCGEVVVVPLTVLEIHVGTEDAVDVVDAVNSVFHADRNKGTVIENGIAFGFFDVTQAFVDPFFRFLVRVALSACENTGEGKYIRFAVRPAEQGFQSGEPLVSFLNPFVHAGTGCLIHVLILL